ncbi:MAG: hypothetical protein ACRD36_01640 [Candidatus Acidiferrum sp.]
MRSKGGKSKGRRKQVGGTFARTSLPQPVVTTAYDVANQLTIWNGAALSYDLSGNMLSDSVNTFTWNARNQVATLNSVSPQYDGYGRRTKNLAGTSFVYDGANDIQELSGSTVTANNITGGVDEFFRIYGTQRVQLVTMPRTKLEIRCGSAVVFLRKIAPV